MRIIDAVVIGVGVGWILKQFYNVWRETMKIQLSSEVAGAVLLGIAIGTVTVAVGVTLSIVFKLLG